MNHDGSGWRSEMERSGLPEIWLPASSREADGGARAPGWKIGLDDNGRFARFVLWRVRRAFVRAMRSTEALFLFGVVTLVAFAVVLTGPGLPSLDQKSDTAITRVAIAPTEPSSRVVKLDLEQKADGSVGQLLQTTEPALRERFELEPPFEIRDAGSFGNEVLSVRLSDIEVPERDGVCIGADGNPWACGLAGRAALNNLIRRSRVVCIVTMAAHRPVDGTCQLPDGSLLSERLVGLGFARPRNPADLASLVTQARLERRGLWNGGWTLRP